MALNSRENTFKVDLANFPRRPSFEQIHGFVNQTLGLLPSQVKRLQINHSLKCAHVKCADLAMAEKIVREHNGRHELEVEGCKYPVRLTIDRGCTEVKVHDLSECVSNEDIAVYLRHFGDVHEVKELSWGPSFPYQNVSSGVRVAVMTLRCHIRSFVTIQGQETLITYRNQPASCKHCTQPLHPGSTCVQNKKADKIKPDNQSTANKPAGDSSSTLKQANEANEPNIRSSYSSVVENKPTNKLSVDVATTGGKRRRNKQQQHSVQPPERVVVTNKPTTESPSPPRKKQDSNEKFFRKVEQSQRERSPDFDMSIELNEDDEDDPEPDRDDNMDAWIKWLRRSIDREKRRKQQ